MVTISTEHAKYLHSDHRLYLCLLYNPHNKEQSFFPTTHITTSLRPFRLTADSVALAATTICRECCSMCSVQSIACSIGLDSVRLKTSLQILFYFRLKKRVTSNKHDIHCTSNVCKLSEPTGSDCNVPILIVAVVCRRTKSFVLSPSANCHCPQSNLHPVSFRLHNHSSFLFTVKSPDHHSKS